MNWKVLCLIGGLWALPHAGFAQNVTDKVDRFTGDRQIAYTADRVDGGLHAPVFTLRGRLQNNDPLFIVQLVFGGISTRRGSGWRYLSCHHIDWIVDGEPLELGAASHRGEIRRPGTLEYISQGIEPRDIAKIGAATSVEYRVCSDEFALTPVDIEAFRIVAEKVAAPS